MTPGLLVLALGGHVAILAAFVWLLYRLGGFTPSARERWTWVVLAAMTVSWVVLLAFIGPLPVPVVLAMNLGVLTLWVWTWRSGRWRLEVVPTEQRVELSYRRQWMRDHVRLLAALFGGYLLVNMLWLVIVVVAMSTETARI